MKQRIVSVCTIIGLIILLVITARNGFNRYDDTRFFQSVVSESQQRVSLTSDSKIVLMAEAESVYEAESDETMPDETMSADNAQTMEEDESDDNMPDSDMPEMEEARIAADSVVFEDDGTPAAVPVLTAEEAETANMEAMQLFEELLAGRKNKIANYISEWRHDNNDLFLIVFLLFMFCMIVVSNLLCLVLKRKDFKKKDILKASVSAASSSLLLLFLYSIMPYFYNYWSVMNIGLIGLVAFLFFRNYDNIWFFHKKEIILIPLVIASAWLLIKHVNPRMRDVPNRIVLETDAKGLTYNGVVCNNNLVKTKKDFFANYKHFTLNGDWKQSRSYHAILDGKGLYGKGRLILSIPTELIETYDLCIQLDATKANKMPKGRVIFNDYNAVQWEVDKETYLIPLKNEFLYPVQNKCNALYFVFCFAGAFVFVLAMARLIEIILQQYLQGNQQAFTLLYALFCATCLAVNFKEILFVDNCPDLERFGAYVTPSWFSSWKPAIIWVWWKIAIFLSPLESWNASFALCALLSFYIGFFLVGNALVKQKRRIVPYLIVFACFNIIHTRFFNPWIFVDQIVASHCVLAFGLCTLASIKKKYFRILLFLFLAYLTFIISLVRGESLSCAAPVLIVFFALTLFESLKGWKRVILSGVLGGIAALLLFCSYKFILSPFIIHERPFNDDYSIIDNYFRETMGICFFSKDWDDLPEWYTEEAEKALDKTRFIERPHGYRIKYLPNVTKEEILVFWAHMVRKHPWTYLKVKWVGNQVQWRLRSPFAVPRDVRLDNDKAETGLSLHNFFKEGLSTCGIVIPSWLPQVSLFFLFVFSSLLLLKFNDSLLWIIWGIGTSGFLHNFAFFLISGAPNYRYIYWADICGCMSFFLSCLVIGKYLEYLRRKHKLTPQEENNDEAVCPDTLFQ